MTKCGLAADEAIVGKSLHPGDSALRQAIAVPGEWLAALAVRVNLRKTEWRVSQWLKSPEDVVPLALFLAEQPDFGPTAQSFSLMRRDG